MLRILTFFLILFVWTPFDLLAQVIFEEDFNGAVLPENLIYRNQVDLAHEYGIDGSSFFRFNPRNERAVLELPLFELNGKYELTFSYSKNGNFDKDSIIARVFKGDGNGFTKVGSIKEDTERDWQARTFDLGEISFDAVRIQFEFLGSGKYPAPYMGLENISLTKVGVISGKSELFENVEIQLLPNPTSGFMKIELNGSIIEALNLKVLGVDGRVVYEKNNLILKKQYVLDLSHLSNGVYQLVLSDNGQSNYSKEVIINK